MNSDSDESNTEETTANDDDLNRPDYVKLRLEEGSDSRRKITKIAKIWKNPVTGVGSETSKRW